MFLYINVVDPNWVNTTAEVWSAQLEESGSTAEQIDMRIRSFGKQWETGYIFSLGLVAHTLLQFVRGFLAILLAMVQPWKKRLSG